MDDSRARKAETHSIHIENRANTVVTGVLDVDTFTEETISLTIDKGALILKGHGLHINRLDLEEGKVVIAGFIHSAIYTEKKEKQAKSLLGRLLK